MSTKQLTGRELVATLITALEALRELEGGMTATKALTLLHVYNSPGVTQSELIASIAGSSQPAMVRNIQDWTVLDKNRKPGPNFITKSPDPAHRNRDLLEPTPGALKFLDKMTHNVNKTLASVRS